MIRRITPSHSLRLAQSTSVSEAAAGFFFVFVEELAVEALARKQSMRSFAFLDSSRTLTRLALFETRAAVAGFFLIGDASSCERPDSGAAVF